MNKWLFFLFLRKELNKWLDVSSGVFLLLLFQEMNVIIVKFTLLITAATNTKPHKIWVFAKLSILKTAFMVGGLNFIVCPYQSIMQCPARKLVLSMTKSCMKSDILACKSPKGSGYIRHHKNNDLKHTIPQISGIRPFVRIWGFEIKVIEE